MMKWEALKQSVAREVRTRIADGWDFALDALIALDLVQSDFAAKRGQTHLDMIRAYADAAYDRVMAWDIRAAGRLRRLFPASFPPSLRTGNLQVDMNEKGDWVIAKA